MEFKPLEPSKDLPNFNHYIAVPKDTIFDMDNFNSLVKLFNLTIYREEDCFVILTGDVYHIDIFSQFWN